MLYIALTPQRIVSEKATTHKLRPGVGALEFDSIALSTQVSFLNRQLDAAFSRRKGNIMRHTSTFLAVSLCGTIFSACATQQPPRWVYNQSQFASRVDYLRFCQRNALHDYRCE